MQTPKTIHITNNTTMKRKHKVSKPKKYKIHNKTNSKKPKNNNKHRVNNTYKGKKQRQKKYNKTQKGGTSILPTVLINIYDSILYGIYNFANALQGVEETVSPLPYLDHF